MYSVIIPTLLKSELIWKLLDDLNNCPEVGEILVIDNSGRFKSDLEKVKRIEVPENIFVNPAWNLGVSLAQFENICLCNDDVNFDCRVFSEIPDPEGVIGQFTGNYYLSHEDTLEIEEIIDRPSGWGCLMFLRREDYKPIPEFLKIACGDDYLLKSLPAFQLKGLKIHTRMSSTSLLPEFYQIQENDIREFRCLQF